MRYALLAAIATIAISLAAIFHVKIWNECRIHNSTMYCIHVLMR